MRSTRCGVPRVWGDVAGQEPTPERAASDVIAAEPALASRDPAPHSSNTTGRPDAGMTVGPRYSEAVRAQLSEVSESVTTRALGPEVQRTRRDQLRERPCPRARPSRVAGAPWGHRRPATPRPRAPLRPAHRAVRRHRQADGHLHPACGHACGRDSLRGIGRWNARRDPRGQRGSGRPVGPRARRSRSVARPVSNGVWCVGSEAVAVALDGRPRGTAGLVRAEACGGAHMGGCGHGAVTSFAETGGVARASP